MKISIITAVYNRERTIGDTVQSVLSQTYSNSEYIVQDGGSTDRTLDILRTQQDPRVFLISEKDSGIYDAINRGLHRASGDIVGLLHSDDIYARKDVLEKVALAFENPLIDCVYGDLQYVAAEDMTRVIRHWTSGSFERGRLGEGWMPPHPTFYIRRHLLDCYGYYDTSFQIAADYDAMLRWLWTYSLQPHYIPCVLVKMRVGGESNRSIGRLVQKSREDYRALRRHGVGGLGTLARKNFRKLSQFYPKQRIDEG